MHHYIIGKVENNDLKIRIAVNIIICARVGVIRSIIFQIKGSLVCKMEHLVTVAHHLDDMVVGNATKGATQKNKDQAYQYAVAKKATLFIVQVSIYPVLHPAYN